MSKWGLHSPPQDQELHSLPTEPARCPESSLFLHLGATYEGMFTLWKFIESNTCNLYTSLDRYYTSRERFSKSSFKGAALCRKTSLITPSELHTAPHPHFLPLLPERAWLSPGVSATSPSALQRTSHIPGTLWASGSGLCMCGHPVRKGLNTSHVPCTLSSPSCVPAHSRLTTAPF